MVRRPDFRLTVWLVAYASLTVSTMVPEDFSTSLEMTGVKVETVDARLSDYQTVKRGLSFEEFEAIRWEKSEI